MDEEEVHITKRKKSEVMPDGYGGRKLKDSDVG